MPYLSRIGTAVPDHEVHGVFRAWAERQLTDRREQLLFRRMADRSGINARWSTIPRAPGGGPPSDPGGFYADDVMPPTSTRMHLYADAAPELALAAIENLGELGAISHVVVASCTGFVAPGIDQIIVRALGLPGSTERTLVGFMGCYAAIAALRTAFHIVRSDPAARVLVVTVELCTLHLQEAHGLEQVLAMFQFGDGAAAAIVSAEPEGMAIGPFFAETLEDSHDLIRWTIGDQGFAMHLAGAVPNRIGEALRASALLRDTITGGRPGAEIDGWAVHAGGRSILDAVEGALGLDDRALRHSRAVLSDNGNMSSATLMFVLARILAEGVPERGVALAFGPGLAAEGFRFGRPG